MPTKYKNLLHSLKPCNRKVHTMKKSFKRYIVTIDLFGTNTNGNPIARHTVIGTNNDDNSGPILFQTRRRQDIGYGNRTDYVGAAMRRAGLAEYPRWPAVITGSRGEGEIQVTYTPEAEEKKD